MGVAGAAAGRPTANWALNAINDGTEGITVFLARYVAVFVVVCSFAC